MTMATTTTTTTANTTTTTPPPPSSDLYLLAAFQQRVGAVSGAVNVAVAANTGVIFTFSSSSLQYHLSSSPPAAERRPLRLWVLAAAGGWSAIDIAITTKMTMMMTLTTATTTAKAMADQGILLRGSSSSRVSLIALLHFLIRGFLAVSFAILSLRNTRDGH